MLRWDGMEVRGGNTIPPQTCYRQARLKLDATKFHAMSLVRYPGPQPLPYLNELRTVGTWAWKNRERIAKVGSEIRGYMRGFRKKKMYGPRMRSHVGEMRGSSKSKRDAMTSVTGVGFNSRTLYTRDVLNIAREEINTSIPGIARTDNINERQRGVVFVKGVKIMQTLQTTAAPVVYHVALVTWKNDSQVGSTDDFFRLYDFRRSADFDPNLFNSMVFNNYAINTDKIRVIWRKKIFLAPPTTNTARFNKHNSFTHYKKYIPIRRQVRWDDDDDPNFNLYFIFWADKYIAPAGESPSLVGNEQTFITTYFADPRV